MRNQFVKAALSSAQTLATQRIFWLRPPEKPSLLQPRDLPIIFSTVILISINHLIMWAISQLVSADRGPSISTPFSVTVAIWNWKKAELFNENANPYVKEVPGQRSSWGSFPNVKTGDTEMGHSVLQSLETRGLQSLPIRSASLIIHTAHPVVRTGISIVQHSHAAFH